MSFPSPADDYSENRLRLDDLIVHREATFFVRHTGLSMEPTIHDGVNVRMKWAKPIQLCGWLVPQKRANPS
jgi:hypothetical protein